MGGELSEKVGPSLQVLKYGTTWKALMEEEFGDGIMVRSIDRSEGVLGVLLLNNSGSRPKCFCDAWCIAALTCDSACGEQS